jgi:penicillin amidase
VIKRKGKPDDVVTFHENDHGTLACVPAEPGFVLGYLLASLDGSGARSMEAMLGMLDATSAEEALARLGGLETAWNWVAADAGGHIGYQMSGRLPLRRAGVSGLVPLPGWLEENDWQGFAPATDLPRAFDPPAGFFVTANQDLSFCARRRAQNSPMGPWRADRIAEALARRDDWTVDAVRALQLDLHSRQADAYLPKLLPLVAGEPRAAELAAWDRRCSLDSPAATLFERFYRCLFEEVIGGAAGPAVARHLAADTGMLADFYDAFDKVLLSDASAWLGGRSRAEVWRRAFARAAAEPKAAWAAHQTVTMAHMVFGGKLPRWLGFDKGGVAIPGSRATICQGQIYRNGGRLSSFAPSYRLVTDLGERRIHSVLAGGHSDRRYSRWYLSDLERWRAGELKEVCGSEAGGTVDSSSRGQR